MISTKIIPDAPGKLRMAFGFEDEPQFIVRETRARLAHLLKSYRAHPDRYFLKRVATHHYRVSMPGSSAVASILPDMVTE